MWKMIAELRFSRLLSTVNWQLLKMTCALNFQKCSHLPHWTLPICDSFEYCLINVFTQNLVLVPKQNETVFRVRLELKEVIVEWI